MEKIVTVASTHTPEMSPSRTSRVENRSNQPYSTKNMGQPSKPQPTQPQLKQKKDKSKNKKLKRSQYGHTPTHLKVAVEKIVTVASTHTREVPVERVVERVVTVPQLTEREVPVTTIVERVVEVPVGLAERVVATTVTHTIEVPVERACGNV